MAGNPTVVFTGPEEVVREDRPVPEPKAGEVLLRNKCTLISTGTELTILSPEFPENSGWAAYGKFPYSPGYSGVGVIESVGKGIDESLVGRTVEGYSHHSAYATVPVSVVYSIREGIADEEAVFLTIAQIVFNGVRRGRPRWGETAVVFGCGLLGQIAVRVLDFAGAFPVVAVDVAKQRLSLLPKSKSVVPLNPNDEQPKDKVASLTGGRMADIVFEVTGAPALIPGQFEVLRKGGRMVMLSSPRGETNFDFHDLCNAPSFTIIGAHNSSHPERATFGNPWTKERHTELFFEMAAVGVMDMKPLISHREPYTKAPELYRLLLADRSAAMGVILDWDVS